YTTPSAHSSPSPVPSPLLPSSRCPTQIQTLRIASTQALIDVVTAALPSPLYIPPPIDRRDDIPETELLPRKKSCLFALGPRYEAGESSTARPIRGRGIDYGFVSTLNAEARRQVIKEVGYSIRDTWVDPAEAVSEIAPMTLGEVNTRVTELYELHEHDIQDLYALLEDAQEGLSQAVHYELQTHRDQVYAHKSQLHAHQTQLQLQGTLIQTHHQAELLALREQPRRAKKPGSNARVPDHHDAPKDADRTEGVVSFTLWIEKMESVFNINGCAIENQIKFATCTLLGTDLTWWNGQIRSLSPDAYSMTWEVLKKKMTNKQTENKRKADDSSRNNHGHQQQPAKRQNVAKVYNMESGKRKPYGGNFAQDGGNVNAQGWVYAIKNTEKKGNASKDPDYNVVTGNSYDVELADGKIVRVDTIMRGCTLNFLNHPFNIDLMPIELGSFDVIIGMDWLRRCHAVITCDEKLVRVPYGNETLIFCGNESNDRRESRLTIISCSNAQEYMTKGGQIFLAHISTKKEEDKSEGKQLKDIPIVRYFFEVFLEDLSGLPLARPVEFQIDLIPGATPKGIKFDWGEKEENAFQITMQKLCSAPILTLPEGSEDFVVYCNSSHKGLGAVLMQREKVIAYASR
nr:reverse transcriptase domain-containing protein [Tanacetum cinerariifolium]